MTHSFDVGVAEKLGLNAAVVFNLLQVWIRHNAANKKNVRDGRAWTYNSVKAWRQQMPYLTPKQVRRALDVLFSAGAIVKANFNENPNDRTLWYALGDGFCPTGQMGDDPLPSGANGSAPDGKCVDHRDTKEETISCEPEKNQLTLEAGRFVEWFLDLLAKTGAPTPRLTQTIRAGWADAYEKLRRIDGKEKAEIARVCEWARNDSFWRTNFFAPTKLRERKDGVSRYDLFLSKLNGPPPRNGSKTQFTNPRTIAATGISDYASVTSSPPLVTQP